MTVKFQTKTASKYTWKPEVLERKMAEFEEYLQEKYEYISKMDMLVQEKEIRQSYDLTPGQAIQVWNRLYK